MGDSHTTIVNNPAALFNRVQTTAPDGPVHSDFVNACAEGQRQAQLNHLIRRGANIDHRDHMQGTPLHHAAFAGHVDTVHYLLDAGAVIDAAGDWVGTPLGLASAKGHMAVVKLRLAHRANPNRCSRYVGTATHLACAAGRLDNWERSYAECACRWLHTHISKLHTTSPQVFVEFSRVQSGT